MVSPPQFSPNAQISAPRILLGAARSTRNALATAAICCLAWVLLAAHPAHALDPGKRISQYQRTSWRLQNGSAPAAMFTVAQTSDGFIWFSAFSPSIYRFDGVRFRTVDIPSKDGAVNKIFKVIADRAGGLWAIGNRGVVRLKGGAVERDIPLEGLSSFQNATEGADGALWIVRAATTVSDTPLCRVTPSAVQCFGKADGVPIAPIDSILADGNGGFWLGGQTSLVHWRDGVAQTYPVEALRSNVGQHGIVSLASGPDGTLWVGMLAEGPGLGLGRLQDGVVKPFVTATFDGSKVEVFATTLDRDGNLWVATRGKGLYRIRGESVDHYGRTNGLSSDDVNLLFEDREGILWAGTSNGLDSLRDAPVATFSASEGLTKDAAVGVLAARDGSIWVANDGALDRILNGRISSIRPENGLPGHQVASMLEDRSGNLWVGVDDSLYVVKDERFRPVPGRDGKPLGLIIGLTEDIDGNIWAGCAGNPRKLVRIRDFEVREEFSTAQVPAARTLAADPQGGIWVGTTKGELVRLRNGTTTKFPLHPKGDPVSRRIVANADGSLLAASEDGLVGLRPGTVQRMTMQNGLPCNGIISFVQDRDKRWWLYADCGVIELADSELSRWWADGKALVQTRLYDRFDGAQPNQPYFNSAAYSTDGRVWFANGRAVQMVDPARLSRNAPPAPTYIESVIADRKEFPLGANPTLPPRPRDLQIDYTSPSFTAPQKVKFRYRLDPYDSDWHDAGTRRQAFYTDLPPGNYTFRAVAASADGAFRDNDAATLDFIIAPAYFQTIWFRLLCAVLLLAFLWLAYRLRVRRLQRQFDMTLDARVEERTRIARELHDTLLQSFHGLLLRFQTALDLLPDRSAEAKRVLAGAIDQAAEAITEGRDAVQGLRTPTMETSDFADALGTLAEELASEHGNNATLRMDTHGAPQPLRPLIRDEAFRIAGEALRNAFRHADAHRIEVELRYDDRQLRVRVRDDGKGIDPDVLRGAGPERHFGLRGMRERAKLAGGNLTVWSAADAGTEVELTVPGARAYGGGSSAVRSWLARIARGPRGRT